MVLLRGENRKDKSTDRVGATAARVEIRHAGPDGVHASPGPADPEVKATRRFSAEYKPRILREADACAPREVAALLRREGLYHSRLKLWRQQRERGELDAPSAAGGAPAHCLALDRARAADVPGAR